MEQALERNMKIKQEIVQLASELPLTHQLAFGATVCEKLIPDYEAFTLVHRWGNLSLLRSTLNVIWELAQGKTLTPEEVTELRAVLAHITPELDEFKSLYTMLAANATCTVDYLLQFYATHAILHIENLVKLVGNGIGYYIQGVGYPSATFLSQDETKRFLEWVYNAPMLLTEYAYQKRDLELLKASPQLTVEVLSQLQKNAQQGGIGILRNGLIVKH